MINSLLPETPKLAHKKCATWSSSRPAWPAEHMVTYFHFEALPVKKFSHLQRKVKKKMWQSLHQEFSKLKKEERKWLSFNSSSPFSRFLDAVKDEESDTDLGTVVRQELWQFFHYFSQGLVCAGLPAPRATHLLTSACVLVSWAQLCELPFSSSTRFNGSQK